MEKEGLTPETELDISVFEIPPAASYFESIQQLQKLNAKLDVVIGNQARILSALNRTEAAAELAKSKKEVALLYERYLLRYFENTDIDPEALKGAIHPDDRPDESPEDEAGRNYRHTSII